MACLFFLTKGRINHVTDKTVEIIRQILNFEVVNDFAFVRPLKIEDTFLFLINFSPTL